MFNNLLKIMRKNAEKSGLKNRYCAVLIDANQNIRSIGYNSFRTGVKTQQCVL